MENTGYSSVSFFGDQQMVEEKIKDLARAEKITFTREETSGLGNKIVANELRIDIFNPINLPENPVEIAKQIITVTKNELDHPDQYTKYKANFIWEDKNAKLRSTTIELKPDHLKSGHE